MYNVPVAFSPADVQRVIFGWGESAEQIDTFDFAPALTSPSASVTNLCGAQERG